MTDNWPTPSAIERAQGCLLGQLAGDSLGALVEFRHADSIRRAYPDGVRRLADGGCWSTLAGQPTDDSEMALSLARTLVALGRFDADEVFEAYRHWRASEPFDLGTTTARGLRKEHDFTSQSNGALMRVSPLGIFGASHELAQVTEWASRDAELTHPNPICVQTSALFAAAIAHAIRSGCGPRALYEQIESHATALGVDASILETIRRAASDPPAEYFHKMGWVLIAFGNALWQLLHASTLEEAVVDTVMRGGDTDTNGAICGALLGAVHGRQAIPDQWLAAVLNCRPRAGTPGVRHPRPEVFWPVDALELAEALLRSA